MAKYVEVKKTKDFASTFLNDIFFRMAVNRVLDAAPAADAVEVPCRCCDCYYLLNSKNSLGLYFFCGHQNGLKNLKNTEKDFCPWGRRRYDG